MSSSKTAMFAVLGSIALSTTAAAGDLGREVLPANDGWAAQGAGTTGGSLATSDQVYVVTNRAELIAALNNGVPSSTSPSNPSNLPKIIYVKGTIDGNVDDENSKLSCEDYYRPDPTTGEMFSWPAFEAAFDPNGEWGRRAPAGPQERARAASAAAQQLRVRIRPGSNTTIVGMGRGATIKGVWLDVRGTAGQVGSRTNIIIRNIQFVDTHDCFPVWAPTDGALGAWNSLYDSISLRDSDHVWIGNNTFEDRETADSTLPLRFGVLFQVHDGLLDITNASDFVTVSWNRFANHDKMMLIGSSDNAPADVGKLRVTLHHNWFDALGQRGPRVRFGQVHVFNNYYSITNPENYVYSWGVGIQSQLYAENNFFCIVEGIELSRIISRFNGTTAFVAGTIVDDGEWSWPDLIAEYNAVNDPDIGNTVGWAPTLFTKIDRTDRVPALVKTRAGAY